MWREMNMWTTDREYNTSRQAGAYHIQFTEVFCTQIHIDAVLQKMMRDKLQKKGWPNNPIRKLCNTTTENPKHAFEDCPFAFQVCNKLTHWGTITMLAKCLPNWIHLRDVL